MMMPALLPDKLRYCEKAKSETDLFNLLITYPPDLILFLEICCSDETWAESHEKFLHLGLNWAHSQFFQDNLMMEFAQRLAKVLRKHPSLARSHLPMNGILKLKDRELPINTLLYGSCSHYLKELIRLEFRDRGSQSLNLTDISSEVFMPIDEFITRESEESIHVKTKDTVEAILSLALVWNLKELADTCQKSLKKWLNRNNAVMELIKSHQNGWSILRNACMQYINEQYQDFCLVATPPEQLAFEFLRFTEVSLDFFNAFKAYITNLICSGSTTADPTFTQVVTACRRLKCLDLSYSLQFTDFLKEIPHNLGELVVSSCNWMNNETLKKLIEICPNLEKLILGSDVNLNFEAWSVLRNLPLLKALDLSRCSQIRNEDLKLILQSAEGLESLSLEECYGITDEGFNVIPLYNTRFVKMNFARTSLSDQPLIELANQCSRMTHLDITRCEKITEKGLLEAIRSSRALKEIKLTNCNVSEAFVSKLKSIKPFLNVIS